jgi:peptide/nickel transport system substrate-binding protein
MVRTIKEDIVRLQKFLFLLISFSLLAFVAACAGAPTPEVVIEKVVETVVVEKEVEGETVTVVETVVVEKEVQVEVEKEVEVEVVVTATPEGPPVMASNLVGEIEGPEIVTDPSQFPTSFSEAPMLTEMVEAGDLPPVEERLPEASELLVIKPVHEIGQYGGVWHRGFTGPADGQNGHRVAGGDRLLFWSSTNFPEMVPNLAKSWETGDDGRTLTVSLRQGVKWSDGEPFTADDIMFWYEDMYLNEELVPVKSPFFSVNGKAGKLVKVDDYTIEFQFEDPNTLFVEVLGSSVNLFAGHAIQGENAMGGFAPKHYMQQFHPKYTDQAEIDAMVEAEGFDNWISLFKSKNTWARNPELPVVTPWKTEVPITGENWVLTRNPYYYGVDTEGNQLPYIDQISMRLAENLEVLNLRGIAGEYDYQSRHLSLANIPVFLENQEAAGYTLHLDPAQHGADGAFMFNTSYQGDEEIGKWLGTADFRRALSIAVDRDQINEIIFLGIGVPGSAVVAETSIYNPGPEYRSLWATYEPDKANEMLDALGLTEKDSEGYRLRTDNGERLVIEVTTVPAFIQFTQLAELVKEDWAEVGIFANIVEQERSLAFGRRDTNETQIIVWQNDGSDELFLYPDHALPVLPTSGMGPGYGRWFSTGGTDGVEPTDPEVIKVQEMFASAAGMTPEERIELGKEIWKIAVDQVWVMGTVGQSGAFMGVRIYKNNMGNIPDRQFNIQAGQTPNISRPATFFFKSEAE